MNEISKSEIPTYGSIEKNKTRSPHISETVYQILEILFVVLFWMIQAVYYIGESLYRKFFKLEPKSVQGEIVLITGSGHGIGKQLALKYADAGATIIGWDINKAENDKTINEINQKYKNKAHGYICDVSKREHILRLSEVVQQEVGEVTILVANAGIMPCHLIGQHTADEIRKVIDINVMQIFWLLEAFLPYMKKKNNGHIVAISSIAGLAGFSNLIPYCTSKFAVKGLMESLREELRTIRNNKIHTTTVFPYMVNTGLCKNPRIKFSLFMEMLSPDVVANTIIMAQRRNEQELSIPEYLIQFTNFLRLFPIKAINQAVDLIDSGIDSDLIEKASI